MSRTMLLLLGTAVLLLAVGGWMVDAARKPLALWSAHSRTSTVS